MRDAATVLGIIRDRGQRGLPVEDVYRQLFNPALYLVAYGKIAANTGALTPGTTEDTADGMSLARIGTIIELLKSERYQWTPVRRVYIEKKGSTWSDKLLQEVIRLILEAYSEPRFSDRSHGFRPQRGCHTALKEIYRTWRGTTWFIEGDIKGCFDNLDHEVMLNSLRADFHDNRFLRLIENLLKTGYLEEWTYHRTLSGTPQGGVVSPILANIYLDRLDRFVETTLLPAYTRGTERHRNPRYQDVHNAYRRARAAGNQGEAKRLRQQMMAEPTGDPTDPTYRRLRYIRYADDFLLGFAGPHDEAEEIKRQVSRFLRDDLKLELSTTKTLVTHARTEAARFLGYEITVQHAPDKRTRTTKGIVMRSATGTIGLKVPMDVVRARCTPYVRNGMPIHRAERLHDAVFSIIERYESEFRGFVAYYRMAYNLHRVKLLRWVMETSLTKTLAHKLKISVNAVYRRYQTTIQTERGPRKVLQVTVTREGRPPLVTTWGVTDLVRRLDVVLNDQPPTVWNTRTEIVERLLADTCELCGSQKQVEVHHIRALKDLDRLGRGERPAWAQQMAARHRTKLIVCRRCHLAIHSGRQIQHTDT